MGYRATQIGVVSRGLGCAGFNSPAVFASVKKILPWIKKIVEANMNKDEFCTPDPPKIKREIRSRIGNSKSKSKSGRRNRRRNRRKNKKSTG